MSPEIYEALRKRISIISKEDADLSHEFLLSITIAEF